MSALSAEPSPPEPAVASDPARQSPSIPSTFTDLSYRATFITLLVGATVLVTFGQQVYALGPNSRTYSPPFIVAGVGLFVAAYWMYRERALPRWLLVLSIRLRASPPQIAFLALAIACAFAARLFAGDSMRMASPTFALAAGLASVWLRRWPEAVPRLRPEMSVRSPCYNPRHAC